MYSLPLNSLQLRSFLSRREFAFNVLNVASGSAVATVLTAVAAPIIARLYSPAEYGIYAVFISLSTLLATICSGRYELAVVMSKNEPEYLNLICLSMLLSALTSIAIFVSMLFLKSELNSMIGTPQNILQWILPLFVFILSTGQVFSNWMNCSKNYTSLGLARIVRNAGTTGAQIGLAFLRNSALGLSIGRVIGELVFVWLPARKLFRTLKGKKTKSCVSVRAMIKLATKHKRFPIYTMPSALVNKARVGLPEILLIAIFDPNVAGVYAITQRIIGQPLAFLANAVKEVFFKRYAEGYEKEINLRNLIIRTTVLLSLIVIFPMIFLFYLADQIVQVVLGNTWKDVSIYLRLLLPAYFFRFLVSSTAMSLYVQNKHNFIFYWTIAGFILSFIALSLGKYTNNPQHSIFAYSIVQIIIYTAYFVFNLYQSKIVATKGGP